ncbi:MAG: hypothetical protein EA393_06995 [Bacteroidetes bacterium]|nr:MAG: hypothetical protein EA393_06995 [Bacteroidota bacterium]
MLQENPDYLKSKKSKKKKVRYKKIVFKITDRQKEALEVLCKRQNTTPVRFLKSVIRKQTSRYRSHPQPVSYVTENQLQLFDLEVEASVNNK